MKSAPLAQFWMPDPQHLFWFSPELVLVATAVAILIGSMIVGRRAGTTAALVVAGTVGAGLCLWRVGIAVADGGRSGLAPDAAAGMLVADNLGIYFKLVLMLFLLCVTGLWWMGSGRQATAAPEFFVLLIGGALGMMLMVSTTNLLMIVIAIEFASLPSYAIVGFDKRDRLAAEASLKYMIFGAVCAAIMLYGASMVYGMYGSLDLGVIAPQVVRDLTLGHNRAMIGLALTCFVVGVAFKISAVPFHFWCPDAFQGAAIEVTTWLSVASKAAGIVLLLRIVQIFAGAQHHALDASVLAPLAWGIGILAALTCTVGNLSAYWQTSVKRLLAYSSIAHAGYMMMAAAIFVHPSVEGAYQATSAVLVYILIYVFMNLGAFGVTAIVVWKTGSDSIDSFTGLVRRAPWLAVPMVVCLVSLVGLPPLGGFIGKYWLLYALFHQADVVQQSSLNLLYSGLVVVAVVNTLLSLFYYLRVVVQMTLRDDGRPAFASPFGGLVLVNACAVMLLVTGVLIVGPMKRTAERYAQHLFDPVSRVVTSDAVASR